MDFGFRQMTFAAALFGALSMPALAVDNTWVADYSPENGFQGLVDGTWATQGENTLYAEWASWAKFTTSRLHTTPQTTPDVGSNADVKFYEYSRTAYWTGGNIYGLVYTVHGTPLSFGLQVTETETSFVDGATRDIVLRISTKGVVPNLVATLNGVQATAVNVFDRATVAHDAYEAHDAEWLWVWKDLSYASIYDLRFSGSDAHMSLDQLAFYASAPTVAAGPLQPVPEPQSYAMFLAGIAAIGAAARRRSAAIRR